MVNLVKHDLEFILKQIEIAEAHAQGAELTDLVTSPLLPYGLRTVDGSYNNLVPGRENWGAADQEFVQLTDPVYRNEGDDGIMFGPALLENNDYASSGGGSGAPRSIAPGDVVDADPRLISNLVIDQTLENPAAITAALEHAGYTGQDLADAVAAVQAEYEAYKAAAIGLPDAELQDRKLALDATLSGTYGIQMDGPTVLLPNVSPDIGDSASYSSTFTFFGQFFDHGLDHVAKGGNGTVYMPLSPDDPLYDAASPHTNFMVMSRASTGEDARNTTTPWVDQNQTYGSHASHNVFLREYTRDADGKPVDTGHLLEGEMGGMSTWADVKNQAATLLGIKLTDLDVGNIPLIAADEYGNFIPGENGFAQIVVGFGADGVFGTADDELVEGNPDDPVDPTLVGAFRTGHAFLLDIAHSAVPVVGADGALVQDADDTAGTVVGNVNGNNIEYDDEMLDAHFIAGDGRVNENVGLTAIHHVFHSEHNRIVDEAKKVILGANDVEFLNQWLVEPVEAVPADTNALQWNGERLYQAGRFVTEMEYQHLVFEEFGRKVQPDIDAFVFEPDPDINAAIFAEFAHVVYRFGHSMLNETVDRVNADGSRDDLPLFHAFLNPLAYDGSGTIDHDIAAGAILRGMGGQVGNEIDEFVTNVLRNQLVGIPLDLAAINIARGRDTGIPTLNETRAQLKEAAGGDTQLDPYASWSDFALNLKNTASIVNFIAAYGTHDLITSEDTIDGKRAAAMAIVFGTDQTITDDPATTEVDEADDPDTTEVEEARTLTAPSDRSEFLNGTGEYAADLGGLSGVDLWIGGLAEKKMDFGGMLGSTFSAVFELQMENLQDGDRFYYLSRVQGLNLLSELEANSLGKMALRNTDLGAEGTAIPGDIFSAPDVTLYVDRAKQLQDDPQHDDPALEAVSSMVERRDTNSDGAFDYLRYNGGDHAVLQGSEGDDTLAGGDGDDTLWGGAGNDRLEAGYGVDHVHGGTGDDFITNSGTDIGEMDFLHGDDGNDIIQGGSGLALIFGNQGSDFISTGPDGKEAFAGIDDDFVLGGDGGDFLLGEAGDDWIEGGARFDTLAGENSELFFNSTIIGHDVLNGQQGDTDYDAESGDDIMFQGAGIQRNNGMAGFDWTIHKGDSIAANSDLGIGIFQNQEQFILRDRFDLVEGLSGWKHDDVLTGRAVVVGGRDGDTTAAIPGQDAPFLSWSNALTEAGVARIDGLRELLSHLEWDETDPNAIVMDTADASDILLGGDGSDSFEGKAGGDVIHGDAWLNVRISVLDATTGVEIATADGLGEPLYTSPDGLLTKNDADLYLAADGKTVTLESAMLSGAVKPGQLRIVREVVQADGSDDADTASYASSEAGVNVLLGAGQFFGGDAEGDRLISIENLKGSNFSDQLGGTQGTNALYGMAGDDVLTGGEGDDVLIGGEGADHLDGGIGLDRANYSGAVRADLVDPGSNTGEAAGDTYVGIEALAGSGVGDLLLGDGNRNALVGNGGDDNLYGRYGNDSLSGNAGDDVLAGAEGADDLNGGAGFDRANYSGAVRADLVDPGSNTGEAAGDTYVGIEALAGSDALDLLLGDGNRNALFGNDGNDELYGRGGDDWLSGNAGHDVLDGGLGDDLMAGHGGADTFRFRRGYDEDEVVDFQVGLDSLFLDSNLWEDGASLANSQDVIDSFATLRGSNAVFDFGNGDSITLLGVNTLDLEDDIQIA